ncbi:MAG: CDP-alcohol phosphatidyltransferase family protein [Ignavibacteria bacterium]|nr:CDP-alcohol phosphatidyltransferase family protein [Ignavibacteria bacterium]
MKREIFYISNIVSMSRFLLLGAACWFLLEQQFHYACLFIFFIWLSDLLDGYLARSRNEISELGKILDPIADKTAVISIVLILMVLQLVPVWYVIITVLRDASILAGGLYLSSKKNIVLQSNWMGKLAVFSIGLTLFLSIFGAGSQLGQFGNFFSYHSEITELLYRVMLFLSLGMMILSVLSYFKRFLTIIKQES